MRVRLLSVELTNRCRKACAFCYNASGLAGDTSWTADDVVGLVRDCAQHGTEAVSLGGGEPLEFPGLWDVLARLRGIVFRSLTTHGLLLDRATADRLTAAAPDKVQLSIHHPGRDDEVERVAHQVHMLAGRGLRSGVNLLVRASQLPAAAAAAARLRAGGIGNDRITYLPMRGHDTPTPAEVARVAGAQHFQSTSCLVTCGRSERFVAVGWDRRVAWCSYTPARAALPAPDHAGLCRALDGLGLVHCGGGDGEQGLVGLPGRAQHGHHVVRAG